MVGFVRIGAGLVLCQKIKPFYYVAAEVNDGKNKHRANRHNIYCM